VVLPRAGERTKALLVTAKCLLGGLKMGEAKRGRRMLVPIFLLKLHKEE
jgi:hypothetical protein